MFLARPQSHLIVVRVTDDSLLTLLALLASVGVAVFTGWLAWQTRKLAKQTEADVSAQWRPVLIWGKDASFTVNEGETLGRLKVKLYNSGPGAALNASAFVDLGSEQTAPIGFGTIARGDGHEPNLPDIPYRLPQSSTYLHTWTVVARYEDLTGIVYVTRLTLTDAAHDVEAKAPHLPVAAALGLEHTAIKRE